jgi:hypothetical protein
LVSHEEGIAKEMIRPNEAASKGKVSFGWKTDDREISAVARIGPACQLRWMRKTFRPSILAMLIWTIGEPAVALPSIIGDAGDPHCQQALHLAQVALRSSSGSLLWPIAEPLSPTTHIVMKQRSRDISGGDALDVTPSAFTTLPRAGDHATTYWATRRYRSERLVIADQPFNWRGDWYYVYLIGADKSPQWFAKERGQEHSTLKPLLGENRWNPPIVLQDAISHRYWLIDRGEPYEVMPAWKVYLPTQKGLSTTCRISFGYSVSDSADQRLPAVRKLAAILDEALGPGTGEGTLQQTAGLRGEVAKEWANASLRPWALTDEPFNSRIEVDRGLAEWARRSSARADLLRRLKAIYPAAERALVPYYAVRFHYAARPARVLARKVLDHMFRSYFVFPKSRSSSQ